jgi:hypothetical protein
MDPTLTAYYNAVSKFVITHLENNLNQEDKVLNEGW